MRRYVPFRRFGHKFVLIPADGLGVGILEAYRRSIEGFGFSEPWREIPVKIVYRAAGTGVVVNRSFVAIPVVKIVPRFVWSSPDPIRSVTLSFGCGSRLTLESNPAAESDQENPTMLLWPRTGFYEPASLAEYLRRQIRDFGTLVTFEIEGQPIAEGY